jgi:5-(aminomethyl)-3-furanmethanol phosphate kinase
MIKVGGSLSENPEALKALGAQLCSLAKQFRIVVVPGGDKFADAVRDLDAKFALPSAVAHRMAILGMDQYGLLLSQVIPDCGVCDLLKEVQVLSEKGRVAVFLPSKLLSKHDPFEPSWDVTSDSIAAYIACKLRAAKLVFVTNVDGVFTEDPKSHPNAKLLNEISAAELLRVGKRTSVDKFLPNFLLKNPLDGYVVNGNCPERVADVVFGRQTVCTRITI